MKMLVRWWKFSVVGTLGTAVQLAALALFNHWAPGHYLYTSTAAIELALLHNFVWHSRYTWRDRGDGSARLQKLVRFHLSNGLVSILANVVVMRLLVGQAHQPVLISNWIATLCCSIANYCLGNRWVFAVA